MAPISALSNVFAGGTLSFPRPPKSHNPAGSLNFLTKSPPLSRCLFEPSRRTQSLRAVSKAGSSITPSRRRGIFQICHCSLDRDNLKDSNEGMGVYLEENSVNSGKGNGGGLSDWATSILLFALWAALMYYVFMLTPDQTPSRDMYFLKKLLNLKGNDGFQMNEVLVSLWYIMGLWPFVYSMLLLPSGRSSKSNVPVWPFLVLSFFGGAYALLPYFVLWRPLPPPVKESDLQNWPLNFLESKITAGILAAAGFGIITYAGLASSDVWKEFYQYFRESKFIHVMSIDFILMSAFAPFWVYNDMTYRKWYNKGSWLLPIALIPLLGPAFYLLLRPSLKVRAENIVKEG